MQIVIDYTNPSLLNYSTTLLFNSFIAMSSKCYHYVLICYKFGNKDGKMQKAVYINLPLY